jgi:hypothetical protein
MQFGHFDNGWPIGPTPVGAIGRQAAKSMQRHDKIRTSVSGVDAAPALFYRLATNVTMMPMAGRLLWEPTKWIQ